MPSVFCRNSFGNTEKQMYSSNGGDAHRSNSSSSASFSSTSSSPAWAKHAPANSAWENNNSSRQSGSYGSREKFERSDNRDRFFLKKDWNLNVDNRSSSSCSSTSSISASGSYRLNSCLPGPATKRRAIGRHGPIVENGRYVTTAAYRSTFDSSFSALRSPPECKVERDGFDSSVIERSNIKDIAVDDGHHHHFSSPPYCTPRFDSTPRYDSSYCSHRTNYANNSNNDPCHRGSILNNHPNGVDGRERSKIGGSYAWDPAHRDRDRDNRTWTRPDYYHRRPCSLPKVDSPFKEWGVLDRDLGEGRVVRYEREPSFSDGRDHREVRERNHSKGFPSWTDGLPIYSTTYLKQDVEGSDTSLHLREQIVKSMSNISRLKDEIVATTNKASNIREEIATINTGSHSREDIARINDASQGTEEVDTTVGINPRLGVEVAQTSMVEPEMVSMTIISPRRLPLSPLESPFMRDSINSRSNDGENDSKKKRPRLTWGQGLAKYEKEKTEEEPLVSRKQQAGIQQECPSNFAVDLMPDRLPKNKYPTFEENWQPMKKTVGHNCHLVQEEQLNTGVGQRNSKGNPWDNLIILSTNEESIERRLTDQIESTAASLPAGSEISVTPNVQLSVLHDVKMFLDNYQREMPSVSKEFLTQYVEIVEHEIDLLEKEIFKLDCITASQHSKIKDTEQDVHLNLHEDANSSVTLDPIEDTNVKYDLHSGKNIGKSHPMGEQEARIKAVDLFIDEIINEVVSTSGMLNVDRKVDEREHGMLKTIDGNRDLVSSILSLNQETSKGCWSAFTHLNSPDMEVILQDGKLFKCPQELDIWKLNSESHEKKKMFLQSKISEEKQSLMFVERVLALKYRTLKEALKQDQVSKPLRKDGGEKSIPSSNLTELNLQCIARPYAGIISALLNPLTEYEREYLKMPPMLLGNTGRSFHSFKTKNALVENPVSAERERKAMNPWSAEERKIFLDKYGLLGKDFHKIASFLEYKSVADCIEFYYKNQKGEEFQKIHRRHQLKKRRDSRASGLYLATTTSASARHREANQVNMEGLTLVAAAAAAISAPKSTSKEDVNSSTISTKGCRERHIANPTIIPAVKGNNKELCGVKGSRSNIRQQQLRLSQEESDSHWTDADRALFLEALTMFGKDFNRIRLHVGTKNTRQCKSFFSKARRRLGLDQVVESHKMVIQSTSENCEACTHKIVEMNPQIVEDRKPQNAGLDQLAESHKRVVRKAKEICEVSVHFEQRKPQKFSSMEFQCFEDMEPQHFEGMEPQHFEDVKLQDSELVKSQAQKLEAIKVELELETGNPDFVEQKSYQLPTVVDVSLSGRIAEIQSGVFEEAHSDPLAVDDLSSLQDVCDSRVVHMGLNQSIGVLSENLNEKVFSEGGGEDSLTTRFSHHDEMSKQLLANKVKDNRMTSRLAYGETPEPVHATPEDSLTLNSDNKVSYLTPFMAELVPAVKDPSLKEIKTRREPTSWTLEEKMKFNDVLKVHGKSWDRLRESLPSKSLTQIKTYFQNSKAKLGLSPGLEGTGRVVMSKRRKMDDSDPSNNQGSGGQSPLSRASGQSDELSLNGTLPVLAHSGGITGNNLLNAESIAYVNPIARSTQQEGSPNHQQMTVNTVGLVANPMFCPAVFSSSNNQQSQLSSVSDLVPLPQVATTPVVFQQQQGIVGRLNQGVPVPTVQFPHTHSERKIMKHKQAIVQSQVADPKQSQLEIRPQQLQVEQVANHLQQVSVPLLANTSIIHHAAGSSQLSYPPVGNPHDMPKFHKSVQIQQLPILQCHRQPQPAVHQVQSFTQNQSSPRLNEQQQHIVKGLFQLSSSSSNAETLTTKCEGGFHAVNRVMKLEPAEDVHSIGHSQTDGDVKLFGQSLLSQPSVKNQQSTCQQLNSRISSVPCAEGTCPMNFITDSVVMDKNLSVPSQVSHYRGVCEQELLASKQIACPSTSSGIGANVISKTINVGTGGEHHSFQAVVSPINEIKECEQPIPSVSFSQFMVSAIFDQCSSGDMLSKLGPQPYYTNTLLCDLKTSENGSKRCDQNVSYENGTDLKQNKERDFCSTAGEVGAVPAHGLPRVLSALVALAEWRLQNANGGSGERLTDEFLNQSWEALQRDPGALIEAGKARGVLSHLNTVRLEESGTADVIKSMDGKMGGGAGV